MPVSFQCHATGRSAASKSALVSIVAAMTVLFLALLSSPRVAQAQADEVLPDPQAMLATFELPDEYQINCFASEIDLPLHNPMAMEFDSRGRLWIAVSPTYPQYTPGVPPDDKLIIVWDSDRDGVADKHRIFLDGLLVPTGFAIDANAVYVAQQPNLWKVTDTDGDDVADRRKIVLHGFATEDSHHSISAFTWGPGGGFYFNEGVFHHTQVETPWGPRRARDAAVFRYAPNTGRFEVASHHGYANPWGHAFDGWGQSVLSDASGGAHYNFAQVIPAFDYPQKNLGTSSFLNRGRPMAGNLILTSRHFPDDVQGTHVNQQSIGFHGVRWDRLVDQGSGWKNEPLPNLLKSSHSAFRPVAARVGPDGALYILDFANPIIGHMQYTHRDSRRDHRHGRVWRITHRSRPLNEPPVIAGQPIPALLAALRVPELSTRHFARRELQTRDPAKVLPQVERFLTSLEVTRLEAAEIGIADPETDRLTLEALWIYQGLGLVNLSLLDRVLASTEPKARAGAVRVLRHWTETRRVTAVDALARLERLSRDPNQRVRLEVVSASGFVNDRRAAAVIERVSELPADSNLRAVLRQTKRVLAKVTEPELYRLIRSPRADFEALPFDDQVAMIALLHPEASNDHRDRAFAWLIENAKRDPARLLVTALERAGPLGGTASDVGTRLRSLDRTALASVVPALLELATQSDDRELRAECLATVTFADQSIERVAQAPTLHEDLLLSLGRLRDEATLTRVHVELEKWIPKPAGEATEPDPLVRFVRIELPRPGILSLAEVEVFSDSKNIALGKPASQSSVAWQGVAAKAVDGDSDGVFGKGSVTHTREPDGSPWWEVDLEQATTVDSIRVWNRADGRLGERLAGFSVVLLDDNREVIWARREQPAPKKFVELSPGERPGRAIQLAAIGAWIGLPVARERTFEVTATLLTSRDPEVEQAARDAMRVIPRHQWPAELRALSIEGVDPEAYQRGRSIYESEVGCISCHGASGFGIQGSYPPLVKSQWVLEDDARLIRIVLHGLKGPITVRSLPFNSLMEARGTLLDDQQLSDVLTYVRNAWGNEGPAITPDRVAEVRAQHSGRTEPWTVRTLETAGPSPLAGSTDPGASTAASKSSSSTASSGKSSKANEPVDIFRWISFVAGMVLIFGPLIILLTLSHRKSKQLKATSPQE